MTPSDPPETAVSPKVYKSLGLNAILDTLEDDRTYSILDLGPALQDNLHFWSQFSCTLHIHDFYRGYREWKAAAEPEEEWDEAAFSQLLPFSAKTVFDIILVWDLLNYFDLRELGGLLRKLSRWCRPGTKLFVLISILPDIPVSPTKFRILSREQIIHEIPSQETKPSPRHQPRDIVKLMEPFTVSCSFLLRQGIQEYVFEFKKDN
jgi:hypothetical protein